MNLWIQKQARSDKCGGAFVFGAILTPPDLFSQVSIALPFVILYEVGILAARLFGKKKAAEDEVEEAAESPSPAQSPPHRE